jgi:hypothetical protein
MTVGIAIFSPLRAAMLAEQSKSRAHKGKPSVLQR